MQARRLTRETPNDRIRYPQKTRIHPRQAELPADLRYDIGSLALAISLVLRSRVAQITALILTLIAGVSAYPVFVSGQRAYKTIRGMSDDAGAAALDEHMDRAEKTIEAFYLMAVLALAGLLIPIKWPRAGLPLTAVTFAIALICVGIAIYIGRPGYRIRHGEFRLNPAVTQYSATARHDE